MRIVTDIDLATCQVLQGTAIDLQDIAHVIMVTGTCSADEWEYARRVLSHALAVLENVAGGQQKPERPQAAM